MQRAGRVLGLIAAVTVAMPPLATVAEPAPTPAEQSSPWVQIDGDSVMSPQAFAAIGEHESAQYQAINNGDGFYANIRNAAEYTIRLVTSPEGNIETYRSKLQQTANEINAQSGIIVQVADATVASPANPVYINPPPGEIYVVISASSGCGTLSGGALGCGGTDDGAFFDGEYRATSGVVWLSPTMPTQCQQPVAGHEIGHAVGLGHFDSLYLGEVQLMKSSTNCVSPISFRAGDVNGLRFTSGDAPSNDNVGAATTVCPYGDTTLSANTWFATKEVGEPVHAGAGPRRSVWYRFAAQATGNATITTKNRSPSSFDTVLAVYTGSMFGTATLVAANDNDFGTLSKVSFTASAGTTYWVAVDGAGGTRGKVDVDFDITAAAPPTPAVGVPVRLMDSRAGGQTVDCSHQATGRIAAGGVYQLPVSGRSWVSGSATSVVLNITAVAPSARGFLTVYPCGASTPNASNLNFVPGEVVPNLVVVKIGTGGNVCIFSSAATDLLVDASGQFIGSGTFGPLSAPVRLLDTRTGGQTADGQHAAVGAVAANVPYELPVAGRAGLPANPATVVLNVTAALPAARGYVTVYPCGQGIPTASNLNFVVGDVVPNLVVAKVGAAGKVCLVSSVTSDLIVDASGSISASPPMYPLNPARLLDTRNGGSTIDGQHAAVGRVAAGGTYVLPVAGRGGVDPGAVTAVLNVTAANPSAQGFVTVYPCDQARPNASNLNFAVGDVVPNAVLAKLSAAGTVCLFSSVATDLLVDVGGYLTG